MVVTADERREVLELFNVSEAARRLRVPVQLVHRDIRAGRLPSPQVRLGRRLYYRSEDLEELSKKIKERIKDE